MDIASEHEIRQRAYEIWVAAGMNDGDAEMHWLLAEKALRHLSSLPVVPTEAVAISLGEHAVAKPKTARAKASSTKVTATKVTSTKAAAPRRAKLASAEAVA